jgi:hypothetical protein
MRFLSSMVVVFLAGCGGADGTTLFTPGQDASTDGTTSDGATPVPADAGPLSDGAPSTTNDGGPGGTTQTLACGGSQCAIPGQSCCVYQTNPTWTYLCVGGSACPQLDGGGGGNPPTGLQCSGAANCGQGTLCCVYQDANQKTASSCMQTCPAKGAQLCDPNASSSGCAADAGTCSPANIGDWGLPKGYATCGGVGN